MEHSVDHVLESGVWRHRLLALFRILINAVCDHRLHVFGAFGHVEHVAGGQGEVKAVVVGAQVEVDLKCRY